MEIQVKSLEIDGRPLGGASMNSAVLRQSDNAWSIEVHADWSSDICDRIRRSGQIRHATVVVVTDDARLSGTGNIEFAGEVEGGPVIVNINGVGPLAPPSTCD